MRVDAFWKIERDDPVAQRADERGAAFSSAARSSSARSSSAVSSEPVRKWRGKAREDT